MFENAYCSISLTAILVSRLIFASLIFVKCYCMWISFGIFLITSELEHVFLWLMTIWVVLSFVNPSCNSIYIYVCVEIAIFQFVKIYIYVTIPLFTFDRFFNLSTMFLSYILDVYLVNTCLYNRTINILTWCLWIILWYFLFIQDLTTLGPLNKVRANLVSDKLLMTMFFSPMCTTSPW